MRSYVTLAGAGILLVAALGFAAQQRRQAKDPVNRDDAVKRALQQVQERPGIHTLSYEGPGRLIQRSEGIFFTPGQMPLPLIMGFRIDWKEHTVLAAREGLTKPVKNAAVEITGWLSIAYDSDSGLLDVSVTDDTGQEFHELYEPTAHRKADPRAFAEFVDEFFQFMNTNPDAVARASAGLCSCECTFRGGSRCTATLTGCGEKCSACSCTCTLPSTCSCTCVEAA